MKRAIGYISFFLLFILVVVMARATWVEHKHGSDIAFRMIYQAPWFNLLWVWAAVTGGYYILKTGLYRRLPVFLLHVSLIVILTGALFTRLHGKTGMIHLKKDTENKVFNCDELRAGLEMPFSLCLRSFRIEYYPGTSSPSNYISIVEVKDHEEKSVFTQQISMNNILKYKGYRFYQSSFDDDMTGSVLSVNNDPVGTPVTYAGYYLLFGCMIWILFDRRGRFLSLLKKMRTSRPEDTINNF